MAFDDGCQDPRCHVANFSLHGSQRLNQQGLETIRLALDPLFSCRLHLGFMACVTLCEHLRGDRLGFRFALIQPLPIGCGHFEFPRLDAFACQGSPKTGKKIRQRQAPRDRFHVNPP